jgi:hypothetical protein
MGFFGTETQFSNALFCSVYYDVFFLSTRLISWMSQARYQCLGVVKKLHSPHPYQVFLNRNQIRLTSEKSQTASISLTRIDLEETTAAKKG